jgi:archaellum component FlaC
MDIKEEFGNLIDRLKTERDNIKLKAHLASMDVKEEFDAAEEKWSQLKDKTSQIADDAIDTSEEYISKAKIVGEELKETYKRIAKRLSE